MDDAPKKWQNLIYCKCPRCGGQLQSIPDSRNRLYECKADGCEFLISRKKVYDILTDEGHIMRAHLSELDRRSLADVVRTMESDYK